MKPSVVLVGTIGDILFGRVKLAAVSLKELISSLSPHNKNSLNCTTAQLEFREEDNTYRYRVKCSESESDPSGHIVEIQLQQDPTQVKDKKNLEVKVNCDCKAFLYQGGQFNLHEVDALLGEARGQLVPPKVRDPVRVNLGCKHVFAVVRQMLDKLRFDKPQRIKPIEKVAPEDEEILEKPGPQSPFERPRLFKPKGPPPEEIAFAERVVPKTLIPSDVDVDAIPSMEQQVIPRIPGVPKLFQREDSEEAAFSTFRPVKAPVEPEEETKDEGQTPDQPEPAKPNRPFNPPKYQLTPKHFDDEDDAEDQKDADRKREVNRFNRKKKLQSILGVDEEDVENVKS